MCMKKRAKSKGKEENSALAGAIRELETEIKKLGREKSNMKQALDEASSAIEGDHQKEKELQEKIARLIEKEAQLNQKKKNLEVKIDKVSDKLTKISKIKSEMSDI